MNGFSMGPAPNGCIRVFWHLFCRDGSEAIFRNETQAKRYRTALNKWWKNPQRGVVGGPRRPRPEAFGGEWEVKS